MRKLVLSAAVLVSGCLLLNAQAQQKKFIKGNISDKTAAVREASGDEGWQLAFEAVDFVLRNKQLLGDDRDLDALAVAAILSLPPEYVSRADAAAKELIVKDFNALFTDFSSSSTVQIAVLSKMLSIKDSVPYAPFTAVLNDYCAKVNIASADPSVIRAVANTLSSVGDSRTFLLFYGFSNNRRYAKYADEIEQTITSLIPVSMNEVLQIVHCKDIQKISAIFGSVQKNNEISTKNLCEIAENVLSESIVLTGSTPELKRLNIGLQMDSLRILSDNRWTRASSVGLAFFDTAKKEYAAEDMSEEQFVEVIRAMSNVSTLDAVSPLTKYLGELNSQTENGKSVSADIVLAVIKTLGDIGDKSAFDSLLAVTYLAYPEAVLSAAREALAGLRW